MDNPSQSQRWTLLETGKGTFSTEDYVDGIVELKLNKPVQIKVIFGKLNRISN